MVRERAEEEEEDVLLPKDNDGELSEGNDGDEGDDDDNPFVSFVIGNGSIMVLWVVVGGDVIVPSAKSSTGAFCT